jgi:hypothetical protein
MTDTGYFLPAANWEPQAEFNRSATIDIAVCMIVLDDWTGLDFNKFFVGTNKNYLSFSFRNELNLLGMI